MPFTERKTTWHSVASIDSELEGSIDAAIETLRRYQASYEGPHRLHYDELACSLVFQIGVKHART